jgi:hypothetical protein
MKGNAKIESTMLGYEDHGIMTCFLHLRQGSSCQGFGGYGLDDAPPKDKRGNRHGDRQPNKLAGFWIKRILETVGVDNWEDLPGKFIRVDGEEFGDIFGIGNITEDKWFYPKKEIEELLKP